MWSSCCIHKCRALVIEDANKKRKEQEKEEKEEKESKKRTTTRNTDANAHYI